MKLNRGYKREDGMIFWRFDKRYKNGEYWITEEKYKKWNSKTRTFTDEQKEKARARSKKWRESNREKHIAYSLKWQKENPERVNLKNKFWKSKNPEKYKLCQKSYSKSVPEKNRINAANRRSRKAKQTCILNSESKKIINCFYVQAERLSKIIGIKFEVDHIVPIYKGGSHEPSNLQILPLVINRKKGAKDIFRWQDYQSPLSSSE